MRPPPSPVPALLAVLLAVVLAAVPPRPAAAFTPAEAKAAMTVTLVRSDAEGCGAACPEWLQLTGVIGPGTPALLSAALARLGPRHLPVLVDSPGGAVEAAMAMGRAIRARRLDVAVAGTALTDCAPADGACAVRRRAGERPGSVAGGIAACASACALLLAAGTERTVGPNSFVGLHQMSSHRTITRVMNYFRVLRRRVGGRTVEVSRTLIETRPISSRSVQGAAPESLYSEVDRYLLGMGVGEAIMPLMRSAPPSGIHWMSRPEMGATHISTDATDARTLVSRSASDRAELAAVRRIFSPAALTLDDGRRWTGVVAWRIDAASPRHPVLIGDWKVPERHLRGSVAISAEVVPTSTASFNVSAGFTGEAGQDGVTILAFRPPRLCDLKLCIDAVTGDAAQGVAAATFDVPRNWRGDFLKALHQRAWITTRVRTEEGWGQIALTLSSLDTTAIDVWETLCCDVVARDDPWVAPASLLPAPPSRADAFLVPGIAPVTPAARIAEPPTRTLAMPALFDAQPPGFGGDPARVRGTVTWTALASPDAVGGPGTTALVGVADLGAADLHVRIQAGRSQAGVLGRLTFEIRATTDDDALFGPPAHITVMNIYDRLGHPLMLPTSVTEFRWQGGYQTVVDVPETGPIAGAIQLAFDDANRRRVTVALPFDPATAALLQAAARKEAAGGS